MSHNMHKHPNKRIDLGFPSKRLTTASRCLCRLAFFWFSLFSKIPCLCICHYTDNSGVLFRDFYLSLILYLSNPFFHESSTDKAINRDCVSAINTWMSVLLRKRSSMCHANASSHSTPQEGTHKRDTKTCHYCDISIATRTLCP